MSSHNYNQKKQKENFEYIKAILNELPSFISDFIYGVQVENSTKLSYLYDIRMFITFLEDTLNIKLHEVSNLNDIKAKDIERFLENTQNKSITKARKLSSLRRMYSYFIKHEKILHNPADIVDMPKIHEKKIIKLDVDEIAILLDSVEEGSTLTARQKKFHEYTKKRDLAIITLLLGTGIRLSECIGIDIENINFEQNAVLITRKGGNEDVVYFGDEVSSAIRSYLDERLLKKPLEGHEEALFLSLQNKRVNTRTVQKLVKKYAKIFNFKNISTHKLRSTYGTNLYRETGDIYLVASVLGHKDVNTTKKHYATMDEDRKRSAAKIIKLRED